MLFLNDGVESPRFASAHEHDIVDEKYGNNAGYMKVRMPSEGGGVFSCVLNEIYCTK